MSDSLRQQVETDLTRTPQARRTRVLDALGIARSSWYHRPVSPADRRRPGPAPKPVPAHVERWVLAMATTNPWYGYKRIAVMCRKAGLPVTDRQAYRAMKDHDLLLKPRRNAATLHQARKLWELLPSAPNELWQMDVTFVHIPGHGWQYAVTVIDYYSRYVLAVRLGSSHGARDVVDALKQARVEAERLHGPLKTKPFLVTYNGPCFVARAFARYAHNLFAHVRIQYRTPTQLGLLERFHGTLKREEVYWRLYDSPGHARECLAEFRERYNQRRPHWALRPVPGGDPYTPAEVYAHGHATQIPKWQGWAQKAKAELDRQLETAA